MPSLCTLNIGQRPGCIIFTLDPGNIIVTALADIDTQKCTATCLGRNIDNRCCHGIALHGVVHPNGYNLALRCCKNFFDYILALVSLIAEPTGMCHAIRTGGGACRVLPSGQIRIRKALKQRSRILIFCSKASRLTGCFAAAQAVFQCSYTPIISRVSLQLVKTYIGGSGYAGSHNFCKTSGIRYFNQIVTGALNSLPGKSCSAGKGNVRSTSFRQG